ncbi:MAG TPA: KH domain-containing protein [Thermodesulfobacteriaceae bacterium]|nr:KH domain-containing protein [Thermodesulfobacteriaceae bacterium]
MIMENNESVTPEEMKIFEDVTVDRAVRAACEYYEVDRDDLKVEILTRGSTGIFGLGGRKARIKAVPLAVRVVEEAEEESLVPEEVITEPGPAEPENVPAAEERCEEEASDQQDHMVEAAKEVLEKLFAGSGLDGKVSVRAGEKGLYIDLSGDDLSLIIGKEGQALDAFEYLMNRILRKRFDDYKAIYLEAQGYREKRERTLTLLAHRMAKKAKKTRRSVTLQPLAPRDRRIVHLALKDVPGVRTRSIGEGFHRKIIITTVRRPGGNQKKKHQKNNSA